MTNGLVQHITVEESTSILWVDNSFDVFENISITTPDITESKRKREIFYHYTSRLSHPMY